MATNPIIQKLIELIEVPEGGRHASPTSEFASTSRPKGTNPHGGFDLNRGHGVGGSVSSPVHGIIGREMGGPFGKIVIHELDPVTNKLTGFDIEILHTQAQSVTPGDRVEPGQVIGTEGGVGAKGVSHAHVQVFNGTDPTPLNPLRHLYEYHYPGQPIPSLPQLTPYSVPPKHPPRRAPANDPIFQTLGPSLDAGGATPPKGKSPTPAPPRLIPYLDQTQTAEQTLGAASSLRPGNAPNVLPNNRDGMISGAPPKYPAIPYLDQTIAAQKALDNSSSVGAQPQSAAPSDFSPRFWWGTTNGASDPNSSSSGWRSDVGSALPTQFAGNAPAGIGAPTANPSPASSASASPSINPLLAATAAYPPTGGGFSYASTLQGMADFIGRYMLPSPSPAMADDRPPFASLQGGLGTIGAGITPPVPLLTPGEQNPLGGGMSGWGASVTGPNAAPTAAAPSKANGGSNVPWPPASVFPTAAPPVSYPPPTSPTKTLSYGDMLALAAGLDPAHPDEPPPGGIPGKILEWMRNNPDGVADG